MKLSTLNRENLLEIKDLLAHNFSHVQIEDPLQFAQLIVDRFFLDEEFRANFEYTLEVENQIVEGLKDDKIHNAVVNQVDDQIIEIGDYLSFDDEDWEGNEISEQETYQQYLKNNIEEETFDDEDYDEDEFEDDDNNNYRPAFDNLAKAFGKAFTHNDLLGLSQDDDDVELDEEDDDTEDDEDYEKPYVLDKSNLLIVNDFEIQLITKVVLNGSSTFGIVNFKRGDNIDISVTYGSLGDLFKIYNKTQNKYYYDWGYDYVDTEKIKKILSNCIDESFSEFNQINNLEDDDTEDYNTFPDDINGLSVIPNYPNETEDDDDEEIAEIEVAHDFSEHLLGDFTKISKGTLVNYGWTGALIQFVTEDEGFDYRMDQHPNFTNISNAFEAIKMPTGWDTYGKGGNRTMPKPMLKKLATILDKYAPELIWVKKYDYFFNSDNADKINSQKELTKEMKTAFGDFIYWAPETVSVANSGWVGITGATERDRSQYLRVQGKTYAKQFCEKLKSYMFKPGFKHVLTYLTSTKPNYSSLFYISSNYYGTEFYDEVLELANKNVEVVGVDEVDEVDDSNILYIKTKDNKLKKSLPKNVMDFIENYVGTGLHDNIKLVVSWYNRYTGLNFVQGTSVGDYRSLELVLSAKYDDYSVRVSENRIRAFGEEVTNYREFVDALEAYYTIKTKV